MPRTSAGVARVGSGGFSVAGLSFAGAGTPSGGSRSGSPAPPMLFGDNAAATRVLTPLPAGVGASAASLADARVGEEGDASASSIDNRGISRGSSHTAQGGGSGAGTSSGRAGPPRGVVAESSSEEEDGFDGFEDDADGFGDEFGFGGGGGGRRRGYVALSAARG